MKGSHHFVAPPPPPKKKRGPISKNGCEEEERSAPHKKNEPWATEKEKFSLATESGREDVPPQVWEKGGCLRVEKGGSLPGEGGSGEEARGARTLRRGNPPCASTFPSPGKKRTPRAKEKGPCMKTARREQQQNLRERPRPARGGGKISEKGGGGGSLSHSSGKRDFSFCEMGEKKGVEKKKETRLTSEEHCGAWIFRKAEITDTHEGGIAAPSQEELHHLLREFESR